MLSGTVGRIEQPGDAVFSYTFAHIERYAVVPVFAQDDWLRWGNATQTRSSNFEGHELKGVYALAPNANLVARFYSVDGIELLSADAVAEEGGKRFRVDIDARF